MFRVSNLALVFCLALSNNNADAFTAPSFGVKTFNVATSVSSSPAFFNTPSVSTTSLRMSDAEPGASKLVRKNDSAVELTITAPGAATKAAYDKACAEISKTISIPGFRKGAKIPAAVIENAMAAKGGRNALRTQAIQSLLNQLLEPALKEEHNLEPVGQPTLATSAEELADSFVPGEPIEMVVACDVWPDIKWKEVEEKEKPYMGLEGTYKRPPFNQARFEKAESDLVERYATTVAAPEGTELAEGDACVVNMEGFMAEEDGVTKGEPLPNAASGDNVEIVLGEGRYMEGLVEGLIGAKVGETKPIYVTFPEGLRDKTLAGKKAVFDVTVLESQIRTVPELDDELAKQIRPTLDAEGVRDELRKAIDDHESDGWLDSRNKVLAEGLAEVMDVDVPDTLVTNQAREKYAQMMAEFRGQGMADEEIKKLITPENFEKYKDIEKADIIKDFKTSMATDEIARLENIEVPAYQIDEQLEAVRKEANGEDIGDENVLRSKIESTLMRRLVFDFLAENANLSVEYAEEEQFDEALMQELMDQTLEGQEGNAEDGKSGTAEVQSVSIEDEANAAAEAEAKAADDAKAATEAKEEAEAQAAAEAEAKAADDAKAATEAKEEAEAQAAAEAEAKAKAADEAKAQAADEAKAKEEAETKAAAEAKAKEEAKSGVKSPEVEKALQEKYGKMDLEERAYNILLDLGMIEITPDPDSADYDHSDDHELVA